jgi:hypothetical protein
MTSLSNTNIIFTRLFNIQLYHSEMKDLKTITTDGVSKLRRREKVLLEEQQKDKDQITEMEKQLESLRSSSHRYSTYDAPSYAHQHPPSIHRLPRTPDERRGTRPSTAEGYGTPRDYTPRDYRHMTPAGTFSERKLQTELSTEKQLRYKAEEICAGVLANSKTALEERDSEIYKLHAQLEKLSYRSYRP